MLESGGCDIVASPSGQRELYQCKWEVNPPGSKSTKPLRRSLDLIIRHISHADSVLESWAFHDDTYLHIKDTDSQETFALSTAHPACRFLLRYLTQKHISMALRNRNAAIKLIIPNADGFVMKSDAFEQRMSGTDAVDNVKDFLSAQSAVRSAFAHPSLLDLSSLMLKAIAGIGIEPASSTTIIQQSLAIVEAELNKNVTFSWLSTSKNKS